MDHALQSLYITSFNAQHNYHSQPTQSTDKLGNGWGHPGIDCPTRSGIQAVNTTLEVKF